MLYKNKVDTFILWDMEIFVTLKMWPHPSLIRLKGAFYSCTFFYEDEDNLRCARGMNFNLWTKIKHYNRDDMLLSFSLSKLLPLFKLTLLKFVNFSSRNQEKNFFTSILIEKGEQHITDLIESIPKIYNMSRFGWTHLKQKRPWLKYCDLRKRQIKLDEHMTTDVYTITSVYKV